MERTNTKEKIYEAALDLFSTKGYEATSISEIAEAVGIRKASLYSHFNSKQEILDTIFSKILAETDKKSVFTVGDWYIEIKETDGKKEIDVESAVERIKGQIRFLTRVPEVKKARTMLVIEQFKNKECAELLSKKNYDDVLHYHTEMFAYLIEQGYIKNADPEALAIQFSLPISTFISVLDREPERVVEIFRLLEKHIYSFFREYAVKE